MRISHNVFAIAAVAVLLTVSFSLGQRANADDRAETPVPFTLEIVDAPEQ